MAAYTKSKPKIELVPELANDFTPLGFFGVGVISLVKAVHDVLIQIDPDHASRNDLDRFFECWGPNFVDLKWPATLGSYFLPGDESDSRQQLRRDNPGERELATFLNAVLSTSIESWKALLGETDILQTPLAFFAAISEIVEDDRPFNKKLKKLTFELSSYQDADATVTLGVVGRRSTQKIDFSGLNFEESSKNVSKTNQGIIKGAFLAFGRVFCEWVKNKHDLSCELDGLPGLRLCDSMAWMHRVVGLDTHRNAEINYSGFFQIIREARGTVTSDPKDMNLLLRDLLWIRSFTEELPKTAVEARDYPPRREQAHGTPLGFYYSVLEGAVYEVKRLKVIGDVLNIEGIALFDNPDRSKPLNMNLPRFDDSSYNYSMGTIMGATNERLRTGAWSVIGVRPAIEKEPLAEIDNIFCLYADALLSMDRGSYNENISKFSKYVQSLGLAGVLASKSLTDGSDADRRRASTEMTSAFRGIFKTSKKHRANCEAAKDKLLADIGDKSEDGERVSFKADDIGNALLELMEQQNSYAIAPTNVFRSDLSETEASSLQEMIKTISKPHPELFNTYAEYRASLGE